MKLKSNLLLRNIIFKTLPIFLILCNSLFTFSQKDVEGSEDHPLLTRYPDSYIKDYETVKFREYFLATEPVTGYRYIGQVDTLKGALTRITYFIDKPAEELSIDEVYLDYAQAFDKAGLNILAKGHTATASPKGKIGHGGWIGLALGKNTFRQGAPANYLFAGTSSAGGSFSIIANVNRPEGITYVALYGERHSKDLVLFHLDVIEVKGAETGKVFADANYISKEIDDKGSVVIYGIKFDFDSSKIKPESEPTIAEIAKYLNTNPKISLYVVGHTDMKGTLEYNLRLSKDRSQAVVDALVLQHNISKSRLIADGVAFLSPLATNDTDDGRAINRRTELVKREQ